MSVSFPRRISAAFLTLGCLSLSSCGGSLNPIESIAQEIAQQMADTMVSIDEMGGASGSLAMIRSKQPLRMPAKTSHWSFIRDAQAAVCPLAGSFSACAGTSVTRTFNGCTFGLGTATGTVAFNWGGGAASCDLGTDGNTVTRVPAFTIVGAYGGTLTVSKTGASGQVLTRTSSGTFSFTNDGIRRKVTSSKGETIFDFTTTTTSPLIVTDATPATRAGRSMTAGMIRVTNNVTNVTCDFSPSNLTWADTCSCPVSGGWTGTCTDGKTGSLSMTSCGRARFAVGADNGNITLDRCASI